MTRWDMSAYFGIQGVPFVVHHQVSLRQHILVHEWNDESTVYR